MPELNDLIAVHGRKDQRLQVKEDIKFLYDFGFISPKYFSKKTIKNKKNVVKKIEGFQEKVKMKASFSDDFAFQEKLRSSENNYLEFQETVKPSSKNLKHLCPLETPRIPKSLCTPVPSCLPKEIHSRYLKESMDLLKNTNFRIKKAKEYITIARRMSKKY
jgi:hypothetical protein